MQSDIKPRLSQRVAAGSTLLLLAMLAVLAIGLALINLPPLLGAWLGLVIMVLAFSFSLRSSGLSRVLWITAAAVGVAIVVLSLILLVRSSFWGFVGVVVALAAIGFLGAFALHERAPTFGRLAAERPVLFVNPKSGGGKASAAGLAEIATRRGIDVRILECGDDLSELARAAIEEGSDAVGIAGGDGSLGYVAVQAIAAGVPFICIPAGTRNHFARDLGLDRNDIVGALDAFEGEIRRIDYASVNGRIFLNVASMGIYAEIVSDPAYRDAKIETTKQTLQNLASSGDQFDLRFSDQGDRKHASADLIMVSSGRYEIKGPLNDIGKRSRVDSGRLGILTLAARDPAAAVEAATLSVAGAIDRFSGWNQWEALEFEVDSEVSVPIGIDGETVTMDPPLRFEIHAGALVVAVPAGTRYGPSVSPIGTVGSVGRLWNIATGRPARPRDHPTGS